MKLILTVFLIVLNAKNILCYAINGVNSKLNTIKMSLQTTDNIMQSHSEVKDIDYMYKFQVKTIQN